MIGNCDLDVLERKSLQSSNWNRVQNGPSVCFIAMIVGLSQADVEFAIIT